MASTRLEAKDSTVESERAIKHEALCIVRRKMTISLIERVTRVSKQRQKVSRGDLEDKV